MSTTITAPPKSSNVKMIIVGILGVILIGLLIVLVANKKSSKVSETPNPGYEKGERFDLPSGNQTSTSTQSTTQTSAVQQQPVGPNDRINGLMKELSAKSVRPQPHESKGKDGWVAFIVPSADGKPVPLSLYSGRDNPEGLSSYAADVLRQSVRGKGFQPGRFAQVHPRDLDQYGFGTLTGKIPMYHTLIACQVHK